VATIARCYETLSAVIDVRAVIHMHNIYKEIRKTTFGSVEIRISIYIKRNCVKIVIFFLPTDEWREVALRRQKLMRVITNVHAGRRDEMKFVIRTLMYIATVAAS